MKIKKEKILLFTKQLNSLIRSGISITQAINILLLSEKDKTLFRVLKKIQNDLDRGRGIFDSFKTYKEIFGTHFLYMLKIGELSGSLNMALDNITTYLEYNLINKRKISSLLIYPTIVFTMGLIILMFLVIFVLPNFLSLFEENQLQIPTVTKVLIFISNNFLYFSIVIIFIFFALTLFLKYIDKKSHLRRKKDTFFFNFFFIGNLIKLYYADEVYYSLFILLNSGISLIEGFDIISENINNLEVKKNILNTQKEIRSGHSIASSFKYLDLFNKRFYSFIKSGEESGYLSETFLEISKILKLKYEYTLKKYIAFIEPLSILFLGFFVIFILFSIYIPIFSMIDIF